MAVLLFADAHVGGHLKVAQLRGFNTAEAHDSHIEYWYRRLVCPDDTVLFAGDAVMGDREAALKRIKLWPGTKHLFLGNHDRPHPSNRNAHTHQRQYLEAFESVSLHGAVNYDGTELMVSHFPYDGDSEGRGGDRYVQWRLRDAGTPIIHGHTHSTEKVSWSAAGTIQICVSVDAWNMRPAPLGEVAALIRHHQL